MSISDEVRHATRQAVHQLGSLRDQARLQLHLLSLDARQRWTELEEEIAALEERAGRDGEKAADTLKDTAQGLSRAVTELVGTLSHSPGLDTNVRSLMTTRVQGCAPQDSLAHAAQTMWDTDCGALPVVEGGKVVAMVTDRDICMATCFEGRPPTELRVADAMSKQLLSCGPDESLASVLSTLRTYRVRRLPVVGPGGELLGLVGQADVLRWLRKHSQREVERAVLEALADVSSPPSQPVPVAPE
jgi:predicted transcriptional regulator